MNEKCKHYKKMKALISEVSVIGINNEPIPPLEIYFTCKICNKEMLVTTLREWERVLR